MTKGVDSFYQQLISVSQSLPVAKALSGEWPFEVWRERLTGKVYEALGAFPDNLPPLDLQIGNGQKLEGLTRYNVSYNSEPGLTVPGYLLIPEGIKPGEKLPAVVALNGHGYGVRAIVGLESDDSERRTPEYQADFALALCRHGLVVIAPELFGFGDLRLSSEFDDDPGHSSCDRLSSALWMVGRSMGGVRVLQAMRALSCLESVPAADTARVGAMGISGGGLVTTFFAALDPRVKAAVVSGYACTFEASILGVHHCVDNYFYGLQNVAEMYDILSLIAPRPMLWEAGTQDPIFPIHAVREAEATVRQVYAHLRKPDLFDVDIFEGEHRISGAKSYSFLKESLSAL